MFDQIWILWGLPLITIPIVIHLLNRLRYRTVPWAAMPFLLKAARHSTRRAKLREFVILACRVLIILFLLLALSRPRIGGWLGLALNSPPETILILLDRSASMEAITPGTGKSKRVAALELLQAAAEQNGSHTRVILIESAHYTATEVPADQLRDIPQTQGTDTSADLPRMVETALFYLLEHQTGKTEIWIASDMQESNWQPNDTKWPALLEQFRNLDTKRPLRIRLLASRNESGQNAAVQLKTATRFQSFETSLLDIAATIHRTPTAATAFPLQIELPGIPTAELDLTTTASEYAVRHQLPLAAKTPAGWGRLTMPQDENSRDNVAWFAYDRPHTIQTAIFVEDPTVRQCLKLAAAPGGEALGRMATVFPFDQIETVDLAGFSSVIWQGSNLSPAAEKQVLSYVEQGGTLVCLPPQDRDGGITDLLAWKPPAPSSENRFTIAYWEEDQGPLANAADGSSIPMEQLQVKQRRVPVMEGSVQAEFKDGSPFLIRRQIGRGALYAFATLPRADWSNLADGIVLLPALQRIQREGSGHLSQARSLACGTFQPQENEHWEPIAPHAGKDIRIHAGVYRHNKRLIAVNCPASEHTMDVVPAEALPLLFTGLRFHLFIDQDNDSARAMPSEAWRTCLFLLLATLLVEGFLTLPARHLGGHHDVD